MRNSTNDQDVGVFLLTPDQFCRRYNVGKTKAYELLKNDPTLKRVKIGRATRIVAESADAWARSLGAETTA